MTDAVSWSRFATPLGEMGIAWSGADLVGVQLPERNHTAALARMRRRWGPGEAVAPESVGSVIERLLALLRGEPADFAEVRLRLTDVPAFHQQVYAIARRIPRGQTRTYGEVARDLGDVTLARAVGQALGENPWPLVVPCHRVVAAGGRPGGFSGGDGAATKLRLLAIEGAAPGGQPSLFD